MSIYLLLYFIISILLLFIWFKVFKKYWNYNYWKYFFISLICYFFWLIIYLLSFTTTYDKEILLISSRLLYSLFVIAWYFMLFFVIFFNNKNKYNSKFHYIIIIIILIFLYFSVFSSYIINDMIYDPIEQIYYEDFWKLYYLYLLLYFIFPFLYLYFSYSTIIKLTNINKIRLKNISLWFILFILLETLFLAIFPLFDIWILQKEQILFFVPFIVWTWYSITRYHFLDIRLWFWKVFVFILSLFWSVLIVNIVRYYYLTLWYNFSEFWWFSNQFWLVDLIVWIFLFVFIYNHLNKMLLWNNSDDILYKQLSILKKNIPYITTTKKLNSFLLDKFENLFKIKYVEIFLFSKNDNNLEIYNYFNLDKSRDLFINDIVFIEENKYKFNLEKIEKELDSKYYLYFPLFNNLWELIGIFNLWYKSFKDTYSTEEIKILKDFVNFLVWHLKYIEIYSKINDLNINLDKKIDEKTIQFNELLNKQNEFIWIVSHEIKTPLSTCIFQIDSLKDDINEWETNVGYINEELKNFELQLEKMSELTNSLFVNQRYDLWKVELYKENVNMESYLAIELKILKNKFHDVKFNINITKKIWYIEIDKVQFSQVISNLVNNAVKFANKQNKIISFKSYLKEGDLIIDIEDNWKWFWDMDTSLIFEKYNTWKQVSVWIGMWLYICDKIVTLHNWKILAFNSKKFWWAKFKIKIRK